VEPVKVDARMIPAGCGSVGEVFGDVFRHVANRAFGIRGAGFDAAHLAWVDRPEPRDVSRVGILGDRGRGLDPGR
jgi:hypothetical protein